MRRNTASRLPAMSVAWLWCLAGLLATAQSAAAGMSNSLLDISADGRWLAAVNHDNGSVSLVDLKTLKKVREIPVGHRPEGVTFIGPSHRLAVTVYADDQVVFLDGDSGEKLGAVDVFDEPYGIVSDPEGKHVYVTLEYPGQVVEIDADRREVLRTFTAGTKPRGIALDPANRRVYVSEYLTATVRALDLDSTGDLSGREVDTWPGSTSDNLARQIVLHPSRPKIYQPHIRSRTNVNQGEGSIVPFVGVLDTAPSNENRRKRIAMDSFFGTFVVANPWEVAVSPDGRSLCAVFAGTDDMYVCDVVDDDYREIEFRRVLQVGHNPRAVRFAPDGKSFYVLNALDFNVAAYDLDSLKRTGVVQISQNPLGDEVLLGKILFYSALQPMVGRRWISCSSCHPDGDGDGRTWQNPEGLRNTQALFGMGWTHPIHWSADRDEVQDFEHTIRGPLMQGSGLIKGKLNAGLADANKGKSAALDALSAYSNSHEYALSPHAKTGLSEAAQRGKKLFFSSETKCATCHSGIFYTDSTAERPFKMHDVGTGGDDPSEKMGPKFDTPTLHGIYRTAPYLHHGRAATLTDVLTTCNAGDKHGKTSHLNTGEIADLVEFLKALPYEDPVPQAKAAGLTKVDR